MSELILFLVSRFMHPEWWKEHLPFHMTKDLIMDNYQEELNDEDVRILLKYSLFTPFVYFNVFNNDMFKFEKRFNPYILHHPRAKNDHSIANILNVMKVHHVEKTIHILHFFMLMDEVQKTSINEFYFENVGEDIITVHSKCRKSNKMIYIGVIFSNGVEIITSYGVNIEAITNMMNIQGQVFYFSFS